MRVFTQHPSTPIEMAGQLSGWFGQGMGCMTALADDNSPEQSEPISFLRWMPATRPVESSIPACHFFRDSERSLD